MRIEHAYFVAVLVVKTSVIPVNKMRCPLSSTGLTEGRLELRVPTFAVKFISVRLARGLYLILPPW